MPISICKTEEQVISFNKHDKVKCKNCGRRAKWVVKDTETGRKYYFCTKKCQKEYLKADCFYARLTKNPR